MLVLLRVCASTFFTITAQYRLYVPSADTLAAVKAALPEGYDPETRVVAMTAEAPQSGSYVIVS